jgi:hypothetical protein
VSKRATCFDIYTFTYMYIYIYIELENNIYIYTGNFQAQTILKALNEDDNVWGLVLITITWNTVEIEYKKVNCCKILLKSIVTQNSFRVVILLPVHLELKCDYIYLRWQGSVVGIATRYGLHGSGIGSREGVRFCAFIQRSHPASCTMSTGGKAAGAWLWPPTPIRCWG